MKQAARAAGGAARGLDPAGLVPRKNVGLSFPLKGVDGRGKPDRDGADEWALEMRAIKTIELLVPVSSMRCRTYTPGLSTWWSTTALKGELVSRWVSRLDAFSDYPVRT